MQVQVNNCRDFEAANEETDQETFSAQEIPGELQMKVYPNPTNGLFTIVLNMSTFREEKIKMRIVNVLGQEIYNKEIIAQDETIKEIVELDQSLPTGIYTLQIMMGNKTENTSVVLSR